MKKSLHNTLKLMVTGFGVAGLMGTGALAEEGRTSSPSRSGYGSSTTESQQRSGRMEDSSQSRQQSQEGRQGQRQAQNESQGVIQSVDRNSQTLSLKGPRMQRDFAWSENTQVLRNGKSVGPEQLKKGDRVSITFQKQGDQQLAQQIEIKERQQARAGKRSERSEKY